ncbi:flagellar basal body rod protein FlgF [Sphingomicrobium astaxanthinifaciens]|uniref:flagellar basal body rod protein FlgF n=1 Tax=Sphingomicrobium astaxanthinifaciens TaxID=1227949 RepID=UPI001FCBF309|nr:flagellar basal body rod protein FlgF [Sphingomicrobium astaxanthinifaciens]MCJ7420379.1 flagellar basal body rod protein FlgF [Sphingomicrobium astaxanthinifaciens]
MDRLIYSALSGMRSSTRHQTALANNLANAQTIGFRREIFDSRPVSLDGEQLNVRSMQQGEVRTADLTQGEIIETGRNLDVALSGKSFLSVQLPDGSEAYTRRGDLQIDASGVLSTGDGYPVMGQAGPITVPLDGTVTINPSGGVEILDPAQPGQPAIEVAQIKLANWEGSSVGKGIDGLFRVIGGGVLPMDEAAELKPGFLEKSNVNSTEILVEMIDSQRLFAMRAKLMNTARDIDESGSQLMRLG